MIKLVKNEKGYALVEVLVALALTGIIAVAFLLALATSSKAILVADERATAESLARSQMEFVKSQTYAASYTAPIPQIYLDTGYTATIGVDSARAFLQKITVTIQHQGDVVMTLEGYKR